MFKVVAIVFYIVSQVKGERILAIFPTASISHQVVFQPIILELARRGHEVTVVTTDPVFPKGQAPENFTEIDIHDIAYPKFHEIFTKFGEGSSDEFFFLMKQLIDVSFQVFEHTLYTKEMQKLIKDKKKYDLLLLEAHARSTLAFSHLIKAPVIQISSFGAWVNNYEQMGAPVHPILYPFMFRTRIYNLSIWEKIQEIYRHYWLQEYYSNYEKVENTIHKKHFGNDLPTLSELAKNVHMLLLNVHPIWINNRPVPPNVIHLGGLHQRPEKALPLDLKSYLDSSKQGVIYVSFGTNVKTNKLPPETVKTMVKVFSNLPYNVLLKWDQDYLLGQTKNIKISKWLPQSDLLRHPYIRLFITQGGLQSTDEAITAGVPLLGIPVIADQFYNVEKYVDLDIGALLYIGDLNEKTFKETIERLVMDERYRRNIVQLRTKIYDQPQTSLERAIWWIEYVLRHGGKHLQAPSAHLTWLQYLEIEIVLVVFTVIFILLSALSIVAYIIWSKVRINFRKIKTN